MLGPPRALLGGLRVGRSGGYGVPFWVPLKGSLWGFWGLGLRGSDKWGYKSPNMGYNYSCPTYNPTYNYP